MPLRAVIDIGTNSVKLLVAEVEAGGAAVRPVLERSEQTRLGKGFYETHRLSAKAVAHTARVVAEFAAQARELGAAAPRVIATSAARDARNPEELLAAIGQASDLRVEIISGEQEAEWAFHGVMTDSRLAGRRLLILDVGGGSTEFILGEGAHPSFRRSFPLGTVRLLEQRQPGDPPTEDQRDRCLEAVRLFLRQEVAPSLGPALLAGTTGAPRLVGTGGTASILGAMEWRLTEFDREKLESTCLTRTQVRGHLERLWGLPLGERRKLPGLPPERADVILTGAAIYTGVMEEFDFGELRVSTRGMRFAAVAG